MGSTLSLMNGDPLQPKGFVAFSTKKLIMAEYPERVGIEPGDKEWEFCRKHFTVWRWIQDTWDHHYGNQLKNRFAIPWRPRSPHQYIRFGYIPVLFGIFYAFEIGVDRLNEVYSQMYPDYIKDTPSYIDFYQVPQQNEYYSKWLPDEMMKFKEIDQQLRWRDEVRRNRGPKPPRYRPPPPEDWD